jgi:3-oxoacyl-[acyl-carrier protein] reductase
MIASTRPGKRRSISSQRINPAMVETEGAHSQGFIGSPFETVAAARTPLGRVGQPEDIADVAVFLASNDSRWLTGEQLVASGGLR